MLQNLLGCRLLNLPPMQLSRHSAIRSSSFQAGMKYLTLTKFKSVDPPIMKRFSTQVTAVQYLLQVQRIVRGGHSKEHALSTEDISAELQILNKFLESQNEIVQVDPFARTGFRLFLGWVS